MLGAMHPESLTFSGGQFREDLKVLGLTGDYTYLRDIATLLKYSVQPPKLA